jgi:MHS family proline/betaine transporter-like MFS transporter
MSDTNTRKVIAAGAIGNVLEWYDFAIYGYFATSIGRTFFPQEDAVAQLLSAFGIFAVGYLMRPLGGALVGHIGDRHGRRAALTFSVAAMAIPTFLVGVLPGYAAIGVAAPIALTILRMIQGLSVGGEYTTSVVFMVEHAPPGRRGFVGALACGGAIAGILLGSATGALLATLMSAEALAEWGWRVPFAMGLVLGLAGYLLRRHISELPPHGKKARAPLVATLREHLPLMLKLAGLAVFNAVGFYLVFVYIVSWLQLADGVAPQRALEINTLSMFLLLGAMAAGGWLSDRVGRKPMLLGGTALAVVGAVPFFWLMHHPEPQAILLGQLGFVVALGMFLGTQPATMVEAVPPEVRCTVIALGYNVCLGIVGGLCPMVATWLVHRTANDLAPAGLIMAAAAVSFLTILSFRETGRTPLAAAVPA